jgi:hypothetical protein
VDNSITTWWDAGVGYDANQYVYMKNWGCNAVRLTISDWDIGTSPGNLGVYSNSAFWTRLDGQVNAAIANGIYPIICGWATMGKCSHGIDTMHVDHYMSVHHSWADYTSVYSQLAQRYAGKGVMYELYNEPLYCNLATYKVQNEAAIDAIRAYDSQAIVIVQAVGSGDWDTLSLQFVQSYAINRSNIVYCGHLYAQGKTDNSYAGIRYSLGSNGAYSLYADWVKARYPVIFTEFGPDWSTTGNPNAFVTTWINNFMAVSDADGYSGYTAWRWSTSAYDNADMLIADWNGTPTPYGNIIKNYYSSH